MGQIVNLRRARKARARDEAEKAAQANRVAHGRAKSEKSLTKAQRDLAERRIEGHRLDGAGEKAE